MLRFSQITGVISIAAGVAMPLSADADVTAVATDIAPVHSLVAMVMEGVDAPDLLIPAQASPHSYAMRPSEARALASADVVFWVGPELTPWLEGPIASLAGDSRVVVLSQSDGLLVLPFREDVELNVEGHDNDDHKEHKDGHHDEHDGEHHDEHEEDDHEGHHDEQGLGKNHDHHHDHAGGIDPHLWLDPHNAAIWLDQIAEVLSEVEPENAATFRANAERGKQTLARTEREIRDLLKGKNRAPYILTHDAYQYFENRFGLAPLGAINNGDAVGAGAARMSELQERVGAHQSLCAFTEPQYNQGLIAAVTQGVETRVSVLDPLGVDLSAGPELYPSLLAAMGSSFANCLVVN